MRIRIKKKIVKRFISKLTVLMDQGNSYAPAIFLDLFACDGNKDAEIKVIRRWERTLKKVTKGVLGVVS